MTGLPDELLDLMSRWYRRVGLQHKDGACGLPRMCRGLFTQITRALNRDDMGPEEREVIQAIIPNPVVDLRALAECVQDMAMANLAGGRHMAGARTMAPGPLYARHGSPVTTRQEEVAREYLQRAGELDRKLGTPEGAEGPMTKEMKSHGSRVLVLAIGAFAEMPSDVDALADVAASVLAAGHI